jgi:hypothetical protein
LLVSAAAFIVPLIIGYSLLAAGVHRRLAAGEERGRETGNWNCHWKLRSEIKRTAGKTRRPRPI